MNQAQFPTPVLKLRYEDFLKPRAMLTLLERVAHDIPGAQGKNILEQYTGVSYSLAAVFSRMDDLHEGFERELHCRARRLKDIVGHNLTTVTYAPQLAKAAGIKPWQAGGLADFAIATQPQDILVEFVYEEAGLQILDYVWLRVEAIPSTEGPLEIITDVVPLRLDPEMGWCLLDISDEAIAEHRASEQRVAKRRAQLPLKKKPQYEVRMKPIAYVLGYQYPLAAALVWLQSLKYIRDDVRKTLRQHVDTELTRDDMGFMEVISWAEIKSAPARANSYVALLQHLTTHPSMAPFAKQPKNYDLILALYGHHTSVPTAVVFLDVTYLEDTQYVRDAALVKWAQAFANTNNVVNMNQHKESKMMEDKNKVCTALEQNERLAGEDWRVENDPLWKVLTERFRDLSSTLGGVAGGVRNLIVRHDFWNQAAEMPVELHTSLKIELGQLVNEIPPESVVLSIGTVGDHTTWLGAVIAVTPGQGQPLSNVHTVNFTLPKIQSEVLVDLLRDQHYASETVRTQVYNDAATALNQAREAVKGGVVVHAYRYNDPNLPGSVREMIEAIDVQAKTTTTDNSTVVLYCDGREGPVLFVVLLRTEAGAGQVTGVELLDFRLDNGGLKATTDALLDGKSPEQARAAGREAMMQAMQDQHGSGVVPAGERRIDPGVAEDGVLSGSAIRKFRHYTYIPGVTEAPAGPLPVFASDMGDRQPGHPDSSREFVETGEGAIADLYTAQVEGMRKMADLSHRLKPTVLRTMDSTLFSSFVKIVECHLQPQDQARLDAFLTYVDALQKLENGLTFSVSANDPETARPRQQGTMGPDTMFARSHANVMGAWRATEVHQLVLTISSRNGDHLAEFRATLKQ